jgi:hypothetical protein
MVEWDTGLKAGVNDEVMPKHGRYRHPPYAVEYGLSNFGRNVRNGHP